MTYLPRSHNTDPESASPWLIVPPNVLADERLSAGEKLVSGRVFGFIQKHGYCVASNDYLGRAIGMSKNTVRNYLSHLYELGYLRYDVIRDENNEVEERRIYPHLVPHEVLPLVPNKVLPRTTPRTLLSTKERKERNNNVNENLKVGTEKREGRMRPLSGILQQMGGGVGGLHEKVK